VIRTYDYDPYGNQLQDEDANDENPYRYCGEYYDTESGYTYLRARYYDSAIGRFVSEDPAMDGYNWYVYAANNPIMYRDPSGNVIDTIWDIGSALYSTYSLIKDPSWANAGWLALDVAAILVPFVPSVSGAARATVKGVKAIDAAQTINRVDNVAYAAKAASRAENASVAAKATGKVGNTADTVKAGNTVDTAKTTDKIVYASVAADGTTQYVGITNDVARRSAEHFSKKGIVITNEISPMVSNKQARAMEQALIKIHGLKKNGGTLINKINSISVSNPIYAEALQEGYELLNKYGYKW
jgi:RHS repeat-associated protein